MGIISIQPGNGTFIREKPPESFKEALAFLMVLGNFSARDLIEMRECVEIYAVRLAVERGNSSDIKDLGRYCDEMEDAYTKDDKERFVEYDIKFHLHIVKSTRNPLLWQVINSFQDLLYKAQEVLKADEGILKRAIRDHRQIHEAFIDKDVQIVEAIIKRHLGDVASHFRSMRAQAGSSIL
jgi:GntR family transcriptional repressor for pyruvate dehydrogenase complex